MSRILKLASWVARQQIAAAPARTAAPARGGDRPFIARGQLTSFHRFRSADAQELLQWGKHDDLLLESYNMCLRTRDEAQRWFEARLSWADSQLYAVDSLEERRVIGYIGLREIDISRRSSVLGISFDPAVVGRGCGTDALRTFLRHYFETWKYNLMLLDVAAPNVRAQRCYEHCGFQYTGQRWKGFVGPTWRASRSPLVKENPDLFRYSGASLSMLYYDMRITRQEWLEAQARLQDTAGSPTPPEESASETRASPEAVLASGGRYGECASGRSSRS